MEFSSGTFPFFYFGGVPVRQHYAPPDIYLSMYGDIYICDHPVYDRCTLYRIGGRGLAVIQQRFDELTKSTFWCEIDPWLTDDIYLDPGFFSCFDEYAGELRDGLFPTMTVRQLMWRLKMKPLPREIWETSFDRRLL